MNLLTTRPRAFSLLSLLSLLALIVLSACPEAPLPAPDPLAASPDPGATHSTILPDGSRVQLIVPGPVSDLLGIPSVDFALSTFEIAAEDDPTAEELTAPHGVGLRVSPTDTALPYTLTITFEPGQSPYSAQDQVAMRDADGWVALATWLEDDGTLAAHLEATGDLLLLRPSDALSAGNDAGARGGIQAPAVDVEDAPALGGQARLVARGPRVAGTLYEVAHRAFGASAWTTLEQRRPPEFDWDAGGYVLEFEPPSRGVVLLRQVYEGGAVRFVQRTRRFVVGAAVPGDLARSDLAERFAPVVEMAAGEVWSPVALGASYFAEPVDLLGAGDALRIDGVSEAREILSRFGYEQTVLNHARWSERADGHLDGPTTLYASFHEDPSDPDALAITYWMFFVHDPKAPSFGGFGAHDRDRESVTVFLSNRDGWALDSVMFAGHVDGQTMRLGAGSWRGPELVLGGEDVDLVGEHPVVYPALGSHAVHPRAGQFELRVGPVWPDEPAGGGPVRCPPRGAAECVQGGGQRYSLDLLPVPESLGGDSEPMRHLLHSGAWVDGPLWENSTFPPTQARYESPFARATEAAARNSSASIHDLLPPRSVSSVAPFEYDCADQSDGDGDGAADCADADCADHPVCSLAVTGVSPVVLTQATWTSVTITGNGFAGDGTGARLWFGEGVEVRNASRQSLDTIVADVRPTCAAAIGPTELQFAQPWEPGGTACGSAGRACLPGGATVVSLPACLVDADLDGVPAAEDCDDEHAGRVPDSPEICDGVDNDCDEVIDEGCAGPTYYAEETMVLWPQVWTLANSPHVVTGTLWAGADLTIEPGVEVRFAGPSGGIGFGNGATLTAVGTELSPIVFRPDAESPSPGDWIGLGFGSGTAGSLRHVDLGWAVTAISAGSSAEVSVEDSTLHDCSQQGLSLAGAGAIRNNVITGADGAGYGINGMPLAVFLDNVDESNVVTGFEVTAAIGGLLSAGTRVLPDLGGVYRMSPEVSGPGAPSLTVPAGLTIDASFVVVGGVTPNVEGGTLVLEPGVRVRLHGTGQNNTLFGQVLVRGEGVLQAVGTAQDPVIFESDLDPPTWTDWLGIRSSPGATVVLDHAVVRDASTALTIEDGATATVHDTVFENSRNPLRAIGAPPPAGDDLADITGNVFNAGADGAVAYLDVGRLDVLGADNVFNGTRLGVSGMLQQGDVTIRDLGLVVQWGEDWLAYVLGEPSFGVGGPSGPTVEVEPGVALRLGSFGTPFTVGDATGCGTPPCGGLVVGAGGAITSTGTLGGAAGVIRVEDAGVMELNGTASAPIVLDEANIGWRWAGVVLAAGSSATMTEVELRNGRTCIEAWPGSHSLTNVALGPCQYDGIVLHDGASPSLSGVTFSGIGGQDVATVP